MEEDVYVGIDVSKTELVVAVRPTAGSRGSSPPDQRSHLAIDPWTAADVAGLPAPIGAETTSVPAEHGLRLDDDDRVQERGVQSIQPYQQQAIDVPQSHALRGLAP